MPSTNQTAEEKKKIEQARLLRQLLEAEWRKIYNPPR